MSADQQVIDMVNRKHEQKRQKRQEKLRRAIHRRWLIAKLYIALLAIVVFALSAGISAEAAILCVCSGAIGCVAVLILYCAAYEKNEKKNK